MGLQSHHLEIWFSIVLIWQRHREDYVVRCVTVCVYSRHTKSRGGPMRAAERGPVPLGAGALETVPAYPQLQ